MADRYWVGGSGSWSTTNTTNWSTSSGGAGGASVPTTNDNVIIDTNSGGSGIMTVNVTENVVCANFSMSNITGGTSRITGNREIALSGSIYLGPSVSFLMANNGSLTFTNTAPVTITSNGVSIGTRTWNFTGSAPVTCVDPLVTGPSAFNLTTAGGLVPNGNRITFNRNGTTAISGVSSWTVENLTVTSTSGSSSITGLSLGCDLYVTNLTIIGLARAPGCINITSSVQGTPRMIYNVAFCDITNAQFRDIHAIGGVSFWGYSVADLGGNYNIAFTPPVTRYWVPGGNNDFNSSTNWSDTSGGVSGASVPMAGDDVVFDSNSGSGFNITSNTCRFRNLTCSTSFSFTASQLICYGNVNVISGTITSTSQFSVTSISFESRGINTLSCATTWATAVSVPVNSTLHFGSNVIFEVSVNASPFPLNLIHTYNGAFDSNGYDITYQSTYGASAGFSFSSTLTANFRDSVVTFIAPGADLAFYSINLDNTFTVPVICSDATFIFTKTSTNNVSVSLTPPSNGRMKQVIVNSSAPGIQANLSINTNELYVDTFTTAPGAYISAGRAIIAKNFEINGTGSTIGVDKTIITYPIDTDYASTRPNIYLTHVYLTGPLRNPSFFTFGSDVTVSTNEYFLQTPQPTNNESYGPSLLI